MTITLTPRQEQALQQALQQGVFRSVEDFLDAALQALDRPREIESSATPLKAEESPFGLIQKGSFLLHPGTLPEGYDVVQALREQRDEYADYLLPI